MRVLHVQWELAWDYSLLLTLICWSSFVNSTAAAGMFVWCAYLDDAWRLVGEKIDWLTSKSRGRGLIVLHFNRFRTAQNILHCLKLAYYILSLRVGCSGVLSWVYLAGSHRWSLDLTWYFWVVLILLCCCCFCLIILLFGWWVAVHTVSLCTRISLLVCPMNSCA